MSVPFFKSKREAESFWRGAEKINKQYGIKHDPLGPIVKVYVPPAPGRKTTGWIQASKPGNYYICRSYATQLKLKRVK